MRGHATLRVVLVLALVTTFSVPWISGVNASIQPNCIPCGRNCCTCTPTQVTITFYAATAGIKVNGVNVANGQRMTLWGGCPQNVVSLDINNPAGLAFQQWLVTSGSLTNAYTTPTYFTPARANGAVVLIMRSYSFGNWAGYVAYGSGFTSATGNVVLPKNITYVPSPDSFNRAAFWVGIGGSQGQNLLQIVAMEMVSSQNVVTTFLQWEEWPNLPVPITPLPGPLNPGDTLTMSVWYGLPNAGDDSYSVQDVTQGWSTGVVKVDHGFVPNQASAEWIVECPGGSPCPEPFPRMSSFQMQLVSTTGAGFGGWAMPLWTFAARDQAGHTMTPGYIYPGSNCVYWSYTYT